MAANAQKSVAVVGASADRSKFSNKAVRAYLAQGWVVFPVNPRGGPIEGLKSYASLMDIPGHVNRVTIYLPPEVGITTLPDIASKMPDEFFVNPGAESDALLEEARKQGLDPILACSIVEIGRSPREFP